MPEKKLVFETDYWRVLLSGDQYYLGRCVVELKRECGSLSDLLEEEICDFLLVIKGLESALKKAFGATMFNWTCLMNHAYKEENPRPQVHWHFRPRYKESVKFAELIFNDEEFGRHYDNKKVLFLDENVLELIAKKILDNLNSNS